MRNARKIGLLIVVIGVIIMAFAVYVLVSTLLDGFDKDMQNTNQKIEAVEKDGSTSDLGKISNESRDQYWG